MMKRIFTLAVPLFLLFLLLGSSPIFAQDTVPMRTSARDDFSRVVFEWNGDVQYFLDESGTGTVVLKFMQSAKLNADVADFSIFQNIKAPKIISENPLTVSFAIPEGTKVRAFDAKGRVYLDVYDKGQSQAEAKKAEVKPVKPSAEKNEKPAITEKPVKFAFEPETTKVLPAVGKIPPAVPPVKVPEPEKLEAQNKSADPQHVISVTSTSLVGNAVFENAGQLIWAMDQDAFHLVPTVSGPKPEIFGEFASVTIPNGRAFIARMPPGIGTSRPIGA